MFGRLKNFFRGIYKKFTKSNAYQKLKKFTLLRKLKIKIGKIIWKTAPYKFTLHGDPIAIELFKRLVEKFKIDVIVETGTFRGFTTALFAQMFPNVKIYTCEIDTFNYKKAKKYLKQFNNVWVFNQSSPEFLKELCEKNILTNKTLFYLDAHWLDEWPLEQELRIISNNLKSALIVIDDFKVPNDTRFVFDEYEDKECSIEIVLPNISKKNRYNLLFPNYGEEIFKKEVAHPDLVGYITIFQNMSADFNSLMKIDFIKKFFLDESFINFSVSKNR